MATRHRPNPTQKKPRKAAVELSLPAKMPEPPDRSWAQLVHITPTLAKLWMRKNTSNRTKSAQDVVKIRRQILSGRYLVNGSTIKFDSNLVLRDGQTRLEAIIGSGMSVWSWVIFDLEPGAPLFETIDINRKRQLGQMLAIREVKNYNAVATAISVIYSRDEAIPSEPGGFATDIGLRLFEERPEIQQAVAFVLGREVDITTTFSGGTGAGLYHLMSRKDADLARWFWEGVGSGVIANKRCPRIAVRDFLLRNKQASKDAKKTPTYSEAIIIKGWNLSRAGKKCSKIVWGDAEGFPAIN